MLSTTDVKATRIRKQVYELTLDDLTAFPIWEFKLDENGGGQDESTVRPYATPSLLDPADRMFVVRAVFMLADGSRLQRYVTPSRGDDASMGDRKSVV